MGNSFTFSISLNAPHAEEATESILKFVSLARAEAKRAEREYDCLADEIQAQSRYSIDLFGGRATSQALDLVHKAGRACDELYVSYQSLVVTLDEKCRPLLADKPDVHAVKEVASLMKWLNDESEIENNFSASLNGVSSGQFASRKYRPSLENMMKQKYWEQKSREAFLM